MNRDFAAVLYELDEKTPLKEPPKDAKDVSITSNDSSEQPKNLTYAYVVSSALLMSRPDGANVKEAVTRYHLAKKAYEGGVQELKSEDLELIKKAVATVYPPLVVGQVHDWCEKDFKEPAPLPFPVESESSA